MERNGFQDLYFSNAVYFFNTASRRALQANDHEVHGGIFGGRLCDEECWISRRVETERLETLEGGR